MITWDRDMVAAIGDYQLRVWPNVADGWTWYVYLAAPKALHTVAGGTAPDEVSARAAAESALVRRLASYQGLAIAADLARLSRIETAAREVLASGQARYEAEEIYIGDLIPAAKMIALAEAVHGAKVLAGKPPAASDAYARALGAALVEGAEEPVS